MNYNYQLRKVLCKTVLKTNRKGLFILTEAEGLSEECLR